MEQILLSSLVWFQVIDRFFSLIWTSAKAAHPYPAILVSSEENAKKEVRICQRVNINYLLVVIFWVICIIFHVFFPLQCATYFFIIKNIYKE